MKEQDPNFEPFSKFVDALAPWLGEVVLVGGWAHRLYRLDPRARKLDYLPLTTLDGDVAVPPKLKNEEWTVRKRLLEAGFEEEFLGEDRPPATHYHYGKRGGFYAEFLAPLEGGEYDREGKRKATKEVGGVSFPQYDTTVPIGPIGLGPFNPPFTLNTRTPFNTNPPEPPLPTNINGVPIQDVVNDPITLLQQDVQDLVNQGYTFEGFTLNIATTTPLTFLTTPNAGPNGATIQVNVPQFGGGIENIQFLSGESQNVGPGGKAEPVENAQTAVVYATFWIEKATNKNNGDTLMQLQYAQLVLLNFPILHLLRATPPTYVNLGWPHITVATLKKSFS
jgi:hypothetical protein